MKTATYLVTLGLVMAAATAPAAPSLKLKRYFALKVKPFNQSMFAAQDRNGNYYLAGTTSTTEFDFNSKDWLVAKYSPTGTRLWYRTFNGKGSGGDIPGGIAVDRLGNVIVCGYTEGLAQEGSVGAVVKWDSNGTRRYVRYSPGTASAGFEYDDYRAMAVDYLGNVYVAGSRTGSPATGIDMLVEKLSPTLVPIWSQTWSQTSGNQLEQALMMDLHTNGTVYIGGDAPWQGQMASGVWIYTSQGANTKFLRFLGNNGYGRVSTVRAQGNRMYVFGDFRGTGLVQDNEGSLFSNTYTADGGIVFNRLRIGNNTISRNTVGGAVAPDGTTFHVANTYISGNTSDTIVQGDRYRSGVSLGLASVNLPNAVYGKAGISYEKDHAGIFYTSFVNGSNRMYYAPVLGNALQSGQAVVLNLPGQKIDTPSTSPTGETLVPYTENGAAGVRVFETATVSGDFEGIEVSKAKGTFKFTYHAHDINMAARVRIRIYLAGQETPFVERTASFGPEEEPGLESAQLPAGAVPGSFLVMTIQRVDFMDKAVGPAETTLIPIVP